MPDKRRPRSHRPRRRRGGGSLLWAALLAGCGPTPASGPATYETRAASRPAPPTEGAPPIASPGGEACTWSTPAAPRALTLFGEHGARIARVPAHVAARGRTEVHLAPGAFPRLRFEAEGWSLHAYGGLDRAPDGGAAVLPRRPIRFAGVATPAPTRPLAPFQVDGKGVHVELELDTWPRPTLLVTTAPCDALGLEVASFSPKSEAAPIATAYWDGVALPISPAFGGDPTLMLRLRAPASDDPQARLQSAMQSANGFRSFEVAVFERRAELVRIGLDLEGVWIAGWVPSASLEAAPPPSDDRAEFGMIGILNAGPSPLPTYVCSATVDVLSRSEAGTQKFGSIAAGSRFEAQVVGALAHPRAPLWLEPAEQTSIIIDPDDFASCQPSDEGVDARPGAPPSGP